MVKDENLRAKFYRIQNQFAIIIYQDVIRKGGFFYSSAPKPKNDELNERLLKQGDDMSFLAAGGGLRFVPDKGKL
jgi:hypothetical protein